MAAQLTADVSYGPDPRHRYDVYTPDDPTGSAVVLVHGGGWWQGDKGKEGRLAGRLADDGHIVFVPNYRLADPATGANRHPTQIEDVATAVAAITASDAPFDRARLAVMGGSSGGNIAVEIGLRLELPVVSWSGLIVLDDFLQRRQRMASKQLTLPPGSASADIDQTGADDPYYKWCVEALLGSDDLAVATAATSVHRVDRSAKPMLLVNSLDEFVPRTEPVAVAEALSRSGVQSQVLLLPGNRHAEGYFDDAIDATLLFLRRQLAAREPSPVGPAD